MRADAVLAALTLAAWMLAPAPATAQFRCATARGLQVSAAPVVGARCRRVGPSAFIGGSAPRPHPGARGERALLPMVTRIARSHGLPPALVAAVVRVESGFNPRARSRAGAIGLMQLMPATAAALGVDDPLDPEQNVDGGCRYLKGLLEEFPLELALAAYNAGPHAVRRYGGVPPYAETQRYVPRVLARRRSYDAQGLGLR